VDLDLNNACFIPYNDCSHYKSDLFSFHAEIFGVGAVLTFSIAARFISRFARA
jgi:hypothetical protein